MKVRDHITCTRYVPGISLRIVNNSFEESARTLVVLEVDGWKKRFNVKEHTHVAKSQFRLSLPRIGCATHSVRCTQKKENGNHTKSPRGLALPYHVPFCTGFSVRSGSLRFVGEASVLLFSHELPNQGVRGAGALLVGKTRNTIQ